MAGWLGLLAFHGMGSDLVVWWLAWPVPVGERWKVPV